MERERIMCNINIDEIEPNVLLIQPFHLKDFDNDSIYEFKLPDLYATNGSVLKAQKIKYITKPSIMYAEIKDIRNRLGDIDISDDIILYQIKEASRLIEFYLISKTELDFKKEDLIEMRNNLEELKDTQNYIWQFVVYKSCYEALTTLYIYMATKPEKVREILSDLSKEITFNLNAIKKLLDDYKKKYEDILNMIVTFADPKFALRGRMALPVNIDLGAPYYKTNGMGGYNRAYNNYDVFSGIGRGRY